MSGSPAGPASTSPNASLIPASAASSLAEWQKSHRETRAQLEAARQKAQRIEERLYSGNVKNPKELGDLQLSLEAQGRLRASLEDEVLEDYSLRVAETWKLGRGKFDDGALLLIARDDRKMRLEVGYGLEGTIPDAYSKRILDGVLQPRFRSGDFDGGVEAAVDAIAGLVRGDESLPPPTSQPTTPGSSGGSSGTIPFLFFLVPVGMFSLQALGARGGAAWFLYFFLMPFWLIFPLSMFGAPAGYIPLVLWIVGFPILRKLFGGGGGPPQGGARTRSGGGPIFIPGGGGWSSSRGGWGGGFGGGFSGGGGGFGGGGASGSW